MIKPLTIFGFIVFLGMCGIVYERGEGNHNVPNWLVTICVLSILWVSYAFHRDYVKPWFDPLIQSVLGFTEGNIAVNLYSLLLLVLIGMAVSKLTAILGPIAIALALDIGLKTILKRFDPDLHEAVYGRKWVSVLIYAILLYGVIFVWR